MLSKKRKHNEFETVALNENCNTILQHKLPPKLNDPRSLKILCSIGNNSNCNALFVSRACIIQMPFLPSEN